MQRVVRAYVLVAMAVIVAAPPITNAQSSPSESKLPADHAATVGDPPIAKATDVADAIQAVSATFRIYQGNHSGTCFVVSRHSKHGSTELFLVTAAHVLEKAEGRVASFVSRTKTGTNAGLKRDEIKLMIRQDGKPKWKRHPHVDVAAMRLKLPENCQYSSFSVEDIADAATVESGRVNIGQRCLVPCYPAKLESTPIGFPILRRASIASYPLGPVEQQRTFFLDNHAFGGDSGAPVVARLSAANGQSRLTVVGLVFAMQRQTDKSIMPYEERIQHTPLGLSLVAHGQCIRETIELLN